LHTGRALETERAVCMSSMTDREAESNHRHPAWCDERECSANPEAIAGKEPMSNWGRHQSGRRELAFGMYAVITGAAAPWPTEVYVQLYTRFGGDPVLELHGPDAGPFAAALSAVVSEALVDDGAVPA